MSEIWLIRHGESESNAGLPTFDTAKIALTARGFAQAEHVAPAFIRPPQLIVTSAFLRAKQSAQPTIERFPQVPVEEWPVHEYTYLSLVNRHNTTLQQRRPQVEAYWQRCDPHYLDGAGAESFVTLMTRAEQFLDRIKQLEQDFVAIFSHGLFIRSVIWALLSGPAEINVDRMQRFRSFLPSFAVPNASILKLHVNAAHELFVSTFSVAHLPADVQCEDVREL